MELSRDFKGIWIPRDIWLSDKLSPRDKVLLAEVHSLDNNEGCIASNKYLANFFDTSQGTISRSLSNLKRLGYIDVTLIRSDKGEVVKRIINVLNYSKKPVSVSVTITEPKVTEVKEEFLEECSTIVDYLNDVAGKKYRVSKSTTKFIKARLNEGYSVSDLLKVVVVKSSQWKGTDMGKYLRPETLFNATKFPSYLEEHIASAKKVKSSDEFEDAQTNFYKI